MKVTTSKPYAVFELTPKPHPKGGEAWLVHRGTAEGPPLGTLRRWDRDEVSMRIGPNSASATKRKVTYWTAYGFRRDDLGIPLVVLHGSNNVAHKREECPECLEGQTFETVKVFDHRGPALLHLLRESGL